jgi:formylglycine-generating enzyme required for sulfatase activity
MFCFEKGKAKLAEYAWFYDNSEVTQDVEVRKGIFKKRWELTTKTGRMVHPVGQLKPNKFGLFDMHGNIYEWCKDWFGDYLSDDVVDVIGIRKIGSKVMRGGSVLNFGGYCACAHRDARTPSYRSDFVGLRLVKEL